jgi:hypothetical protein
MKTPDDIKKGLAACKRDGDCDRGNCPYRNLGGGTKRIPGMSADALAYIQKLESTVNQLSKALCGKDSAALEELLQAASQPKTRWVSVKEELPEPFISVLCYMPGESPHPTVREGYVNRDGEWYSGLYSRDSDEVVMWRPMPLPPKEC